MIFLSVASIYSAQTPGIPDFEIWVSLCIKCKEARHQPGLVMCLNSTVLSGRRVEKRLDCESTVTGRYVTLVMQGKDQQTRMSFSELQVMGVDAKGSTHTHTHTHARTHARTHACTHTHTRTHARTQKEK